MSISLLLSLFEKNEEEKNHDRIKRQNDWNKLQNAPSGNSTPNYRRNFFGSTGTSDCSGISGSRRAFDDFDIV